MYIHKAISSKNALLGSIQNRYSKRALNGHIVALWSPLNSLYAKIADLIREPKILKDKLGAEISQFSGNRQVFHR